jgi:hypothetical protein
MQGWIRLVYCSQKYGFFAPCPFLDMLREAQKQDVDIIWGL